MLEKVIKITIIIIKFIGRKFIGGTQMNVQSNFNLDSGLNVKVVVATVNQKMGLVVALCLICNCETFVKVH